MLHYQVKNYNLVNIVSLNVDAFFNDRKKTNNKLMHLINYKFFQASQGRQNKKTI